MFPLLVPVLLHTWAAPEPAKHPATFVVDVHVFKGDPLGDPATLSRPKIVTLAGQPATFQAGAQAADGTFLGTRFAATVTPAGGRTTVAFDAECVEAVAGGTRRDAVKTAVRVELGKPVRLRMGARAPADQTWAELTVTPVAAD